MIAHIFQMIVHTLFLVQIIKCTTTGRGLNDSARQEVQIEGTHWDHSNGMQNFTENAEFAMQCPFQWQKIHANSAIIFAENDLLRESTCRLD